MKAPRRVLDRRQFLAGAGAGAGAVMLGVRHRGHGSPAAPQRDLPPVRAITEGPRFHWFGYYDKLQFDRTGRRVLGMQVDFEHRSPRPDDVIRIGVVDLDDDCAWTELGTSRAWGWQQGCMLQWRPGSDSEVVWNDRDGDRFVCRVLDVETGAMRTLPRAVYTVSPDGRFALGLDFARVQHMRPGYGYAGVADPYKDDPMPQKSGIHRLDLDSGEHELVLTIAEIAKAVDAEPRWKGSVHYFNHLLFNPDGTRFILLHRWRPEGRGGFVTRMLTARPDGADVRVLDASGHTSHFIWRDPRHVLAWTRDAEHGDGFYVFEDRENPSFEPVGRGVMERNGHCTYLPGGEWILNDTYPDAERRQHPYLFELATKERVPLGHFDSPEAYRGEWRCDLHPRSSRDGRTVCIDSPHGGDGRQLWLIDVSQIVG